MSDETQDRSAGAPDSKRRAAGGDGFGSPLQTRAAFLKNWDWLAIIRINRGACERGRTQHGHNQETHQKVRDEWEETRHQTLTLLETLDFLFRCHRAAPFLFFNGNTFAEMKLFVGLRATADTLE